MKKTNLKAVSQNTPKKSAGKPTKKTTAPKKSTSTVSTKIQRADSLRLKNKADMQKLTNIQKEWERKVDKAKSRAEVKKIDATYAARFNRQEEVEGKSYAAYYNHVQKNFTKAQQKEAMKKSGNFMNKSYINALAGVVKNGKK